MPRLVLPDICFRVSFVEAMAEFADEGRTGGDTMVGRELADHGATWGSRAGFAAYVDALRAEAKEPRPPLLVCSTTWWWVEGEEYLGRISVRHELTPLLLEVGGHVGYDVRRSRRREGHATAMLAAALTEAAALGIDPALVTCDEGNLGSRKAIDPALVTCDEGNLGSRKAIEANGGIVEDQRGAKLRFWVPTTGVGR